MENEDRRLIIETHSQIAALTAEVRTLVSWSKQVHKERAEEMKDVQETLKDHCFYIRLLKWVTATVTPVGVLGAILAGIQWVRAHAINQP